MVLGVALTLQHEFVCGCLCVCVCSDCAYRAGSGYVCSPSQRADSVSTKSRFIGIQIKQTPHSQTHTLRRTRFFKHGVNGSGLENCLPCNFSDASGFQRCFCFLAGTREHKCFCCICMRGRKKKYYSRFHIASACSSKFLSEHVSSA